jgi:GNAT superfamily N-acetyltransferase
VVEIRRLGKPGDLGWVVQAHGELYAAEHGWDTSFEALVARIVADYAAGHDPAREAAWIAELHGVRVGSIFCVAAGDDTAKLRVLLVHPDARGHGLGAALVAECLRFAKAAGYQQMTLWTVAGLAAANHIYRRAGFVLVDEEPLRSFGADLVGQNWLLRL